MAKFTLKKLCREVATQLGKDEAEKTKIYNFLCNSQHWQTHIQTFGVDSTVRDLHFCLGFGMTRAESEADMIEEYGGLI